MPAAYREARRLEGRYAVGAPGEGWAEVEPGGADHAWFNARLGAALYTDSNCGPRYRDVRVEDLSTEMVAGLVDAERQSDEGRTIAGREGRVRVTRGRLDGVEVTVGTAVVNRDACTYDVVVIAPPEGFDAARAGFDRVLAGLEPE